MERKYYENPDHWDPNLYIGAEAIRRQITVEWIPEDVKTVCDVGCGNGTLTNQVNKSHFTVGVDRSLAALRWTDQYRCQADIASIPFADNSFDLVVSTEVIEHLPYNIYILGLSEIVRVARRYILISVPYYEDLELKRAECPKCGCKFHSTYHMRNYKSEDIQYLFNKWKCVKLLRAEGIVKENIPIFIREHTILRRGLLGGGSKFPKAALCPQCGFSYEPELDTGQNEGRIESETSPLISFIKLLWPKRIKPHWWLALYEKQN